MLQPQSNQLFPLCDSQTQSVRNLKGTGSRNRGAKMEPSLPNQTTFRRLGRPETPRKYELPKYKVAERHASKREKKESHGCASVLRSMRPGSSIYVYFERNRSVAVPFRCNDFTENAKQGWGGIFDKFAFNFCYCFFFFFLLNRRF